MKNDYFSISDCANIIVYIIRCILTNSIMSLLWGVVTLSVDRKVSRREKKVEMKTTAFYFILQCVNQCLQHVVYALF